MARVAQQVNTGRGDPPDCPLDVSLLNRPCLESFAAFAEPVRQYQATGILTSGLGDPF